MWVLSGCLFDQNTDHQFEVITINFANLSCHCHVWWPFPVSDMSRSRKSYSAWLCLDFQKKKINFKGLWILFTLFCWNTFFKMKIFFSSFFRSIYLLKLKSETMFCLDEDLYASHLWNHLNVFCRSFLMMTA